MNYKANSMDKQQIKIVTLDQLKDQDLGPVGTPRRDAYESKLRLDVLGGMIKTVRKQRGLTQTQLGDMMGVQKAQVSKLEKSTRNVSVATLLKVFDALQMDLKISVEPKEIEPDSVPTA